MDLGLAGIRAEMADEVFDWLAAPVAAPVAPGKAPVPAVAPAGGHAPLQVRMPERVAERASAAAPEAPAFVPKAFEPLTSSSAPSSSLVKPDAKRVIPKIEIAGEVWTQGEAGGVVLVVQGGHPSEPAAKLAMAMLTAVGLQKEAVAWVGYTHTVKAEALLEGIKTFTPSQVLVLGQAPLGVLLGRNLGVEGWHAAGGQEIAGWNEAPVGVTYPLELLMKQPLFKRLAWQHLLAWGDGNQVKTKE